MTTVTFNTTASNVRSVLTSPTLSGYGKKATASKNYSSYSVTPKSWFRKSTSRRPQIDWDLNKNELEFE